MNKFESPLAFTENTLPTTTRFIYLGLFLIGCAWIGMGLYTSLTVFRIWSESGIDYLGLVIFLTVLLTFMQTLLGIGFLLRKKWILSVIGIHIFVTLFTLLILLPILNLHDYIVNSLFALSFSYIPLLAVSVLCRRYLHGKVTNLFINSTYFLAVVIVAAINTTLLALQ